jgi:hypothetical protein
MSRVLAALCGVLTLGAGAAAPRVLSANQIDLIVPTDLPRVPSTSLGRGTVVLRCRVAGKVLASCHSIKSTSPELGLAAVSIASQWILGSAQQSVEGREVQLELRFHNEPCVDVVRAAAYCVPY